LYCDNNKFDCDAIKAKYSDTEIFEEL
jgi:hypothetical protein